MTEQDDGRDGPPNEGGSDHSASHTHRGGEPLEIDLSADEEAAFARLAAELGLQPRQLLRTMVREAVTAGPGPYAPGVDELSRAADALGQLGRELQFLTDEVEAGRAGSTAPTSGYLEEISAAIERLRIGALDIVYSARERTMTYAPDGRPFDQLALLRGPKTVGADPSQVEKPESARRQAMRTEDIPEDLWEAVFASLSPDAQAEIRRSQELEGGTVGGERRPLARKGKRKARPPRPDQKNIKMTSGVHDAFEELAEVLDADFADVFEDALLALADATGSAAIAELVRRSRGGRGRRDER